MKGILGKTPSVCGIFSQLQYCLFLGFLHCRPGSKQFLIEFFSHPGPKFSSRPWFPCLFENFPIIRQGYQRIVDIFVYQDSKSSSRPCSPCLTCLDAFPPPIDLPENFPIICLKLRSFDEQRKSYCTVYVSKLNGILILFIFV